MKIDNHFLLDLAADAAFPVLLDVERIAPCLPGARVTEVHEDGACEGRLDVRFGPMSFSYRGLLRIVEVDESARRATIVGEASEASGEGTAKAGITLEVVPESPTRCRVNVSSDVTLSGGAASLGNGLIIDVAEETMEDFATRLGTLLRGEPITSESPDTARTQPTVRPKSSTNRLDAGGLVLRVVRRRVRRRARAMAAWLRRRDRSRWLPSGVGKELDLAIAGTGSGALVAAIVAHDAGLKVAIFEKAANVGGGTAYSGGVVWAPMNHVMRRKGIPDSVDDALLYLNHAAGKRGNAELQRAYVENVPRIIEEVERWTGISWVIWTGQPDYYPDLPGARLNGRAILPHPASASEVLLPAEPSLPGLNLVLPTPHMDFVPGFQTSDRKPRDSWLAGRSIIGGLWKAVLERGIEYHVCTPVTGLLRRGETVTGVRVKPDGRPERAIRAAAVLLNTGGMDWNEELTNRYLPGPRAHPQTPPSNTGDGHLLATGAGAGTALMDKAVWHPSIQIPGDNHDGGQPLYRMFNLELSKPHCVVVNRAGKRFATEAAYYALADAWAHVDTLAQAYPNVPSWFVCDEDYRTLYGLPGVREGEPVPEWITHANSLTALAERLGIDSTGLAEEISTYNTDCKTGVDTRFARGRTEYEKYWGDPEYDGPNPTMGPVAAAPFYAFPLHLAHAGTRGGVTIAPNGRALRADDTPIPGLYACGNTAANQLFGAGYASGSAVGSSLVFGYLAAQDVVSRRHAVKD